MACGFESMPHFYRTFKRITSMTPAAYRKSNRAY
ncbi:helix-turn-helix domain-containing protein [Paenibacillus rhizoplanae]